MASGGLEMVGFLLGLLGMLGTLCATVLPYWRVSAHVGSNIVTAVDNMKGLWMECVYQSTGAFQCETYTSVLALPSDLQASRALMVVSLVMSCLGVSLSTLGMQCTVCLSAAPHAKSRLAGGGGGMFVTAGFLGLIPVAWTTHEVVQSFYQPGPSSMKFELGDCLYAGLASSLLSMLGGTLLCVSCCGDQRQRGGRGGGGGGYPYPGGGGGGGGGYPGGVGGVRSSSQTYRNPTLQVGGGPSSVPAHTRGAGGGVGRLHSTSSHSHSGTHGGASERKKAVAGYDVTGYV